MASGKLAVLVCIMSTKSASERSKQVVVSFKLHLPVAGSKPFLSKIVIIINDHYKLCEVRISKTTSISIRLTCYSRYFPINHSRSRPTC